MCVDASLSGWAVVLVLASRQVLIAAGRWQEQYLAADINFLEASTISLGTAALEDAFLTSGDTELLILVDNTSVLSALRRGSARAWSVADAIRPALLRLRSWGCPIQAKCVSTVCTAADAPSRGVFVVSDVALGKRLRDVGWRASVKNHASSLPPS